jgi:hypothetical protein
VQAKIKGKLLKAEQNADSGNVKGQIYDGETATLFYATDDSVCRTLLDAAKTELAEVTLLVFVNAGRDWESKVPNGQLSVKVIEVEQQLHLADKAANKAS